MGHAIGRELVAAPSYNDKADVTWFKRASAKGVTFEQLADIGESRFMPLDALLCTGLMRTLPPDLRNKTKRKETEAWKSDTAITGRQVAWVIYDYYRTEDHVPCVRTPRTH